MGPTLILILLFTIIPFLAAATDAFQTTPDRNDPLKRVASFEQFSFLFRDPAFHKALSNSLLYAFISVPLTMFIAIIISAALSNLLRKTLKGFFQTLFFLPYITSAVAIGLAFAYLFDADTGLLNKILGQRVP
jgi:multiple sugar transport system permease protein